MSIKNRLADILMTLSTIDISGEWENRKKWQSEKIICSSENKTTLGWKIVFLFFCVMGRNDEKQEKETMVDWRQRNKGKGTHEERKTSRMISIHREMISWCFDSLDVALNCRWSISNVIAFQYPVSEPNSMRPVKR